MPRLGGVNFVNFERGGSARELPLFLLVLRHL